MKELLSIPLGLFLLACGAYLLSPLTPIVWTPPAFEPINVVEKNFVHQTSIEMAPYIGHEDSAVDKDGNLYTGGFNPSSQRGFIFKVKKGETKAEKWVDLGSGRAAGLKFDSNNDLWACDPVNGLLKISTKDKSFENKLSTGDGLPFGLLNDLTISKTGTVYVTDSSSRRPFHTRHELLEAHPSGRLLSLTKDGSESVLLSDLFWPNGLLLSDDEESIYLSEMGYYRIWKYFLVGPRAGNKEIWVDNIAGFPNGMSYSNRGTIFVGLIADRSSLLDLIHPFPAIKKIFGVIPEIMQPKQSSSGRLLEYSMDGKLLNSWFDMNEGKILEISSAERWGDFYVLGSDRQTNLSVVNLGD